MLNWNERGCKYADPDLFFPSEDEEMSNRRRVREAKEVCATCPEALKLACLRVGLERDSHLKSRYGVWGGMSARDRERLFDGKNNLPRKCSNGHPYVEGSFTVKSGRRYCRQCSAKPNAGHFRPQSQCARGHELSGPNRKVRPDGSAECRECGRIRRERRKLGREKEAV